MSTHRLIQRIIQSGSAVGKTLEWRNAVVVEPISQMPIFLNPSDQLDISNLMHGTDGPRYQGYAKPLWEQLPIAIDRLIKDEYTRQAVVTIYTPETHTCWIGFQLMIRDEQLHITGYLRSFDVMEFGELDMTALKTIAKYVHARIPHDVRLGDAVIVAGSAHIKVKDSESDK